MAKKTQQENTLIATGRRKTAIARVFLYQTKGEFTVNDKPAKEIYKTEKQEIILKRPFHAIGIAQPEAQFSATIKVIGSGPAAQLGAIVHGISRALALISPENQKALRAAGLLTRDSRMVERKKPYLRKARKAPQYSKR